MMVYGLLVCVINESLGGIIQFQYITVNETSDIKQGIPIAYNKLPDSYDGFAIFNLSGGIPYTALVQKGSPTYGSVMLISYYTATIIYGVVWGGTWTIN